jgi:hypothetical protein
LEHGPDEASLLITSVESLEVRSMDEASVPADDEILFGSQEPGMHDKMVDSPMNFSDEARRPTEHTNDFDERRMSDVDDILLAQFQGSAAGNRTLPDTPDRPDSQQTPDTSSSIVYNDQIP